MYGQYNLSPSPVDILSFDIAQGIIFQGERSGIIHTFTMDVGPGYKSIKKFRGGVQWYMIQNRVYMKYQF